MKDSENNFDTVTIYEGSYTINSIIEKITERLKTILSNYEKIENACTNLSNYDGKMVKGSKTFIFKDASGNETNSPDENSKTYVSYNIWNIKNISYILSCIRNGRNFISEATDFINSLQEKSKNMETSANELDALVSGLTATVATQNDPLNFRTSPNGEIQGQLAIGAPLTILGVSEENGKWVRVQDENGKEGYVFAQYLDFDTSTMPEIDVKTEVSSLNIRSGPGTNNDIVGSAAHGSQVSLLSYVMFP